MDLRLVPVALGCWAASLAALRTDLRIALAVAGVALILVPFALRWGRAWRWVVATALVGLVCGALSTAARLSTRDAPELRELVLQGATAEVELTLSDDPRRGNRGWVVPAELTRVTRVDGGADSARSATAAGAVSGGGGAAMPVIPSEAVSGGGGAARLVVADGTATGALWVGGGGTGVVALRARVLVLGEDGAWAGLLPGQRVRAQARFGQTRGGDLSAAVLFVQGAPRPEGEAPWAQRAAGGLREGLRRACEPLPRLPGGLLPGLVVGDVSRLDPELEEQFRDAGMTHLVAVSGSNVAIVVGCLMLFARWSRLGRRGMVALCALGVVGFVILVRPSPSVLRAAVMAGVALLALAGGREKAALPALSASVLGLVLWDPELAGDAGFALSVLATGGLLILSRPIAQWMVKRRVPALAAEAIAVPVSAQLACAPVIAAISGTVSLVAVPANLLVAPAIAPATLTGVAASVLGPVWPSGAEFAAWLGSWPARWLVAVAQWAAQVPHGVVPWPAGAGGALLLAGLTALLIAGARHAAVRRWVAVAAVAAMLGALPVRLIAGAWPPPGWLIVMCDVGQGDALVLNAGPEQAVVVDTGPDPDAMDSCLTGLDVHTVPLLVISHYHLDHIGGLSGALRDRALGEIAVSGSPEPASGREAVEAEAGRAGVSMVEAKPGAQWTVGQVRLTVMPLGELRGTRSDANNNSVVILAVVGGMRILLTGDAEVERQAQLRGSHVDIRADVLKVPHHGSSFQDLDFLDQVNARVALVSVGAGNDYGHPNNSVLEHLRRGGAQVLRTDLDGEVAVARDGDGLAVVRR